MSELTGKPTARIGLIGAGFMGRCHANAFRAAHGLFDLPVQPELALLADVDDAAARLSAAALGFAGSTGDWRSLTEDPAIDIVAITAPNSLHREMALSAIDAGKTVYCEKPLSTSAALAGDMVKAARLAGTCTLVGFNFLRNPMIRLAREIIVGGDIGEVTGFRGIHAENYMTNPETPHSFRTDPQGGGALADIGSHIISIARHLLGPITEVCGVSTTVHTHRPESAASGTRRPVEVDDRTVFLARFDNGVTGTIEADWTATGRKMNLAFEVTGTRGAIAFNQDRMNEIHVYSAGAVPGRDGFSRIEAGPEHPPFGNFCPAAGHQLGFNDLKVIEVAELLDAHVGRATAYPDFQEACEVQRTVDAVGLSTRRRTWTEVASI